MKQLVLVVAIGFALGASADPPSPKSERAAQQKLLCAKIWLTTSSASSPTSRISLENRGTEGGGADVYVNGDMMRIDGQVLQESEREHFDYRYDHGQLVCSEEMHTSLLTIKGGDDVPVPQRAPAYWRVDSLVLDHGELVQSTFDEAPGANQFHRTATETQKNAQELFALAAAAIHTKHAQSETTAPPATGSMWPEGKLAMGIPVVLGSIDKKAIERVVEEHAAQVRSCYEAERAKTPRLVGKLKMKWMINPDGTVSVANVEETQLHDADVEDCIVVWIKSWRFPKPIDCAVGSPWPGAANEWGSDIIVDPASRPTYGDCLRGAAGPIVVVSYPFVFK